MKKGDWVGANEKKGIGQEPMKREDWIGANEKRRLGRSQRKEGTENYENQVSQNGLGELGQSLRNLTESPMLNAKASMQYIRTKALICQ